MVRQDSNVITCGQLAYPPISCQGFPYVLPVTGRCDKKQLKHRLTLSIGCRQISGTRKAEGFYDAHMVPDLVIVIVAYNSVRVIGELLDSIPAAAEGLSYEVVVIDNGSTDGTPEVVATRGGCRVVRSVNTGYAAGINRGVRAGISAEAILVLNPDVRLHEKSVLPLLSALSDPDVGIVVPQVRSASGSLEPSLRREPSPLRGLGLNWTGLSAFSEYLSKPSDYDGPRVVDWALGAVMLMSRKCHDAIGGWDESFFLYSEETDFCLRARDAGFLTRYEPRSVVTHIGGQSGRDRTTHAMQSVNRVRLYRRRHGILKSWCYFWLTIACELSWLLRGQSRSWYAVIALLVPARRPPEINCNDQLIPR
jgi:N-acetylglucosaminyl-diphospho-decaprenol L-rhamnosyltransferase